eukprot:gnl/MRDRNA2_/MRDRNA2_271705_c0_seq1.p1 gnl/MRDRNA2_/MRDRNA2_271705_c0~~gnl/MRDRNA2_/MRDRNA2_271705_c0_seq1.p1  ORF type:complete len:293 (+),score=66.77 gnl/MRDRNA2_/MRDRNA2_271705_c0_seq1:1-879(+)
MNCAVTTSVRQQMPGRRDMMFMKAPMPAPAFGVPTPPMAPPIPQVMRRRGMAVAKTRCHPMEECSEIAVADDSVANGMTSSYSAAEQPHVDQSQTEGGGAASTPASPSSQRNDQDIEYHRGNDPDSEDSVDRDYTQVPKEMDRCFEKFDEDSALRPTIINVGDLWTKKAQKALLANPSTSVLDGDQQKQERNAAFDLLDALTKSGALPIDHADLHVVVAATHCFDKSVTATVVQDNVSPIEKVERSMLIMAATVHQKPPASLIHEAQRERVGQLCPAITQQLTYESPNGGDK